MKHATDMANPFTDEVAEQLFLLTPRAAVSELAAFDGPVGGQWENVDARVREIFRRRARRFLQGDLSVEPWRLQPPACHRMVPLTVTAVMPDPLAAEGKHA